MNDSSSNFSILNFLSSSFSPLTIIYTYLSFEFIRCVEITKFESLGCLGWGNTKVSLHGFFYAMLDEIIEYVYARRI